MGSGTPTQRKIFCIKDNSSWHSGKTSTKMQKVVQTTKYIWISLTLSIEFGGIGKHSSIMLLLDGGLLTNSLQTHLVFI